MRLTLRTLLAYLDDTLEPAQAKLIGQKVAESEQARELVEHIKQVTRRRRITTPPTGPGSKFDPNTIAEYLDNAVSAEQASEVEQICLASDVHLAEVAACHQILALVLGEPSPVPPTAKQRMYGLVKGPEAIPFRKPAPQQRKTNEPGRNNDEDETLRMGLPPVGTGGKWSHRMMLLAAGLTASCLLVVAIWQVLPGTYGKPEVPNKVEVAQGDAPETKKPEKEKVPEKVEKKALPKEEIKLPPQVKDELPPLPPPPFPVTDDKTPVVDGPLLPELRYFPPDNREVALGKYLMPAPKETSVIVAGPLDKNDWRRLWGKQVEVVGGRTYVSLPGCRGELQLLRDVQLSLWGTIPEIVPAPPVLESVVDLHSHDAFDLDMTHVRGRVLLTSARQDKPVVVRVRFENPTLPKEHEFVDMALQGRGTQVLIDRWSFVPPGEPFFKNPKDTNRLGPAAGMAFFVLKGPVMVRMGSVSYGMPGPPGRALLVWNSMKGLNPPQVMESIPDAVAVNPPPPPGIDKKIRDDVLRARDDMGVFLTDKAIDVGLTEFFKSAEPARRIMVMRAYVALNDVGSVIDGLADEARPEVRQAAIRGLQHWMASGRDNEYKVYDQLKTRYTIGESEKIMELFHGYAKPEPVQLDILVDYLNNSCLPIRELAFLNLFALVPAGRQIAYDPTAEPARRVVAQKAWREALRKPPPTGK